LLLAAEGAQVVVNDLGGSMDGTGADTGPAQDVVEEIKGRGGEAVAKELSRYGATVNAVAPGALTRLTEAVGMAEGWHRGPSIEDPSEDPTLLGSRIDDLVKDARANANMQGYDES
jgi:NAD(P)-dependent dehydrogenase (short-subunit alcohol dehydrogenase family)